MSVFSKSFVFTLIFSFGFYLTYNQVFNGFPSDILAHLLHAKRVAPTYELEIAYPIWHILVYSVSELLPIDIKQSAVIVTAFIMTVLAVVIFSIVKLSLKNELLNLARNQKEHLFLAMTVVLMVATAVYVPFFNKNQYLGQAHCGVWHNVTLLMVKPFAFMSFISTVLYFEKKSMKWGLLALIMSLLSIYAKPSFIVAFLPALFIFYPVFVMQQAGLNFLQLFSCFVEMLRRYKHVIFYLVALSIISILILFGQFTSVYSDVSTSKVVFDFLGVWSMYTPNIAGSILLTYLFPLTVLFLVEKKESNAYLLALILNIVSVFIFAVFAEEGQRYAHGNFGWSQQVAVQILFAFSLVVFVKKYERLVVWKKYILSVSLSLHVVSGVFYLIKIMSGLPYV